MDNNKTIYFGTGHRKESVARVRLVPGSGKITINGIPSESYLQFSPTYIRITQSPLSSLGLETKYDVIVEEHGYEEGNRFFYKYYNGKHIVKEIDLYDEWFLEKLNFIPSEEALKNEEIYDEELMEYSYENMNNVFENWHINVSENEKEWEDVILPNIN